MIKIEYSPSALEDLQQLFEYLTTQHSENTAKKILKQITFDISRLEIFPLSGASLSKLIDAPTDYYYIFTEKNFVFYRTSLNSVRIIRVLNEKQNYLIHLFKDSVDDTEK